LSDGVLKKAEFKDIANAIRERPFSARKVALVAARAASGTEVVETHWNGKETRNTAMPGDFIVTSLTRRKTVLCDKAGNIDTYVIKPKTFAKLYTRVPGRNKFGRFFKSKSVVFSIYLAGGFNILAPWGQRQRASEGYLVLNGKDVYGNNAETFEATYERVGSSRSKRGL
jgi:hypothetical protein